MTTTTHPLHTIYQAIDVGVELKNHWFRGHQTVVGALTPRFFREYGDPITGLFRPDREMVLIEDFKRDAPAIDPGRLPREEDILGWLYLMQHYRAPTRLLDWTENVLAALFFTVSNETKWNTDGELWAMLPWALNQEAGVGWGTPLYDRNPGTDFLAKEPYWRDREALAREIAEEYKGRALKEWCENPKPFDRPVAFQPRRDFARMLVQSSVFTIHPKPSSQYTIPEILTDHRHLTRYIIPKERKKELFGCLQALGITSRALFPDFEGLSRTIAPPLEDVASGPLHVPPHWEEEREER